MSKDWEDFCKETEEDKVLTVAEQMVSQNVDFKFYQNYFFNPQSVLLSGKNRNEIKTFTQSPLYKKLRDLGDVLGFRQGYLRPAGKKK
jgi:hypothetical protein